MFCTKCGTKNDESGDFCTKCGAALKGSGIQGTQGGQGEVQEKVLLTVPKCARDKLGGRVDFYNLIVTSRRLVCGKTGAAFLASRGTLVGALVEKIARDKQDAEAFSSRELDEIVDLDKDNFAVPFFGFDEIKVSKQLGQPYIRFRLNNEGRRFDRNSAVPKTLRLDGRYLETLQLTLKNLAGPVVRT